MKFQSSFGLGHSFRIRSSFAVLLWRMDHSGFVISSAAASSRFVVSKWCGAVQATAMMLHSLSILGLSLLAATTTLSAQDTAPAETPLFVTTEPFAGMDDRLFPLGWSADGKFAWMLKPLDEAAGENRWSVTIQDMTTNTTTATAEFIMGDDPAIGIQQVWAKHAQDITALLNKHGIQRTAPVMDHFPLVVGRRRSTVVNVELEVVKGRHADLEFTGVKSFQVFWGSDRKSALFRKTYDDFFPFTVAVAGCFTSPDEKYAAMVITGCSRGWEGAPHPRSIEALAGFKLDAD